MNMTGTGSGVRLDELQRHFDSQRDDAIRLIREHNALLASLLGGAAPALISAVAAAPPAAPRQGKVVSLFDYGKPSTAAPASVAVAAAPKAPGCHVFRENDPDARRTWGRAVDALLAAYGADDALAINRKYLANTVFLSSSLKSLFYFKSQSGVMFVVCFVGPDVEYAGALGELKAYAQANDLQVNLMAHENRVQDLKAAGFSTTPMGIWQRIHPLSAFTLDGQAMRRLRYLVGKYGKSAVCKTIEYEPGTKPEVDEAICRVMDQWVELKGQNPAFVPDVKTQVRKGGFGADHRFFLTYRDGGLDNVMVFSRDNFNDGYLMDLEFYGKGVPLGSTEFALSRIIEQFKSEGRKLVSLGLTMATDLFEHENGSRDVHSLFENLRKANYLNGDANAQYKNKYRPAKTTMYLARPADAGKKKLNDLMLLLGSANS